MDTTGVKRPFAKQWADIPEQLAVLARRGLVIDDEEHAASFLSYINYYRFTGYCLRFQYLNEKGERLFKEGTHFRDIEAISILDCDLRDSFAQGLELIEISFRSSLAHNFGKAHGPFGHTQPDNLVFKSDDFAAWLDKLRSETRRSHEQFISHFRDTYAEYPDLPIWMACEVASFGSLSKLYTRMRKPDMRAIAMRYRLQPDMLDSWLHAFAYLRNVCAHHARLWDKSLSITPQLPPGKIWDPVRAAPRNSVFPAAMTINWMLAHDSIPSAARKLWTDSLESVLGAFKQHYPELLPFTGFPEDWMELPCWTPESVLEGAYQSMLTGHATPAKEAHTRFLCRHVSK